jgi:adhesin/invasin
VTEGAPAFTLTVQGAYFTPTSTVLWNNGTLATAFASTAQVTATVPANLVAAAGSVSITVSNPGRLISKALSFAITAAPAPVQALPTVASGGVVNAFSALTAIAPGALVSIYGTNLAPGEARAGATPLPRLLNGTSVNINGMPVPLLFVSATQINAQVPFEIAAGTATMVVRTGTSESAAAKADVRLVAPGILAPGGGGHALAVNYPGGALNSLQNPVHPGEYVVVYLTGQGMVDPPVPSGGQSPAEPLSLPVAAVQAKLGGKPAEVAFAGLAPGFVGLLQVNLLVPDVPAGEQSLEVTIGDVQANIAALWIAANR